MTIGDRMSTKNVSVSKRGKIAIMWHLHCNKKNSEYFDLSIFCFNFRREKKCEEWTTDFISLPLSPLPKWTSNWHSTGGFKSKVSCSIWFYWSNSQLAISVKIDTFSRESSEDIECFFALSQKNWCATKILISTGSAGLDTCRYFCRYIDILRT